MNFLMIILTASFVLSIMMLALLGFSFLSRKMTNAQTRYFMWVILLIGLIIPFRPLLGKGLIQLEDPTYQLTQNTVMGERKAEITQSPDSATRAESAEAKEAELQASNSLSASNSGISLGAVIFGVWALGALFSFGKYMIQYRRFHRLVKRWAREVTDPYTLETFEFVKARMGLEEKKIGLLSVSTVSTPMLTGIFKPVILLPEKPIEDDEMELILEHELTHYKHKDLWINLIGVIALSIHWFNPIVYFCLPAIYGDGESYCDETVLKNKNTDYRRFYGEVIISMIEASPQKHIALSTCFYAKKLNIKKRLYNIMDGSKRRRLSVLSLALVLGLTLVSGSIIVFGAPGERPRAEVQTSSKPKEESSSVLTLEEVKDLAMKDAKLKFEDTHFVRVELNRDKMVYDVEFYSELSEFDYEIDAKSGAILKQDRDIENFNLPKNAADEDKKDRTDSDVNKDRDKASDAKETQLETKEGVSSDLKTNEVKKEDTKDTTKDKKEEPKNTEMKDDNSPANTKEDKGLQNKDEPLSKDVTGDKNNKTYPSPSDQDHDEDDDMDDDREDEEDKDTDSDSDHDND